MKKLGQGWQYTVYDLGNDRVFKKRNSKFTAYLKMLKNCYPYKKDPISMFPKYYKWGTQEALDSIKKIQTLSLDPNIFGNPIFHENGIDYEQDKVIPLHTYFENNPTEEGFRVIDKFIKFNKMLIENNLIDKSFNIGANFGLNKQGEIVLSDIGELWSNPENIKKQIEKRVWSYDYILRYLPSEKLREYFISKMDQIFL
jgi:hypothetical protein